MIFVVAISFLLSSALTAPLANDVQRDIESPEAEDGSVPVAVLLVVPEQPAFREDGEEPMDLSPEKSLPVPVSDERAAKAYYGDYASPAAVYKPEEPVAAPEHQSPAEAPDSGAVVATFSASVSPSAIPILLSCAPKVVTGKLLAEPSYSKPAYRSVWSDLNEILTPSNTEDDFNLGDVLGLNSPSSMISLEGNEERKRRSLWAESGATRYKVSEDYPEPRHGNHHLISEDYPRPNMIRLTPHV